MKNILGASVSWTFLFRMQSMRGACDASYIFQLMWPDMHAWSGMFPFNSHEKNTSVHADK